MTLIRLNNTKIILLERMMDMKIVSLFNNKGGVGKSTLAYHLGCALGEMGKKVLLVDLDPQCNLSISAIFEDELEAIWKEEEKAIDDMESAREGESFAKLFEKPRTIHFLLKPTEDGLDDHSKLAPPMDVYKNVHLIPGRLSIHQYENKISERWSGIYQGDNLGIRTVTKIREICEDYAKEYEYDYIIIDTSPSLGILNRTIISTVDGFIIPTFPDMFSLYGIKNIGNSLALWKNEFDTIYRLITDSKRNRFPTRFVQFMGYTIYNAKPYKNKNNEYGLADAHYRYVEEIPKAIDKNIKKENQIKSENIMETIGHTSVMYSHNTFPSVAQALKCPMWEVPDVYSKMKRENKKYLELNAIDVNQGSYGRYRDLKDDYMKFAEDFIKRSEVI